MKFMDKVGKLVDMGKTRGQMQKEITVFEVWGLWNLLTSRYQCIAQTQILANFVRDIDLSTVMDEGLTVLRRQAEQVEKELDAFGIPLPERPAAGAASVANVEVITDEYVFKCTFSGVAGFMPTHLNAILHATTARLREMFRTFLQDEITIYDRLMIYGEAKGWVDNPPMYRV